MSGGKSNAACRLCDGRNLECVEEFSGFSLVTSDCRPCGCAATLLCCPDCGTVQKLTDETWRRAVGDIYASYAPYSQAGGCEQRVFDASGGSMERSARFLEFALERTGAGECGSLLDIGCGNGSLLQSMWNLRPGWTLAGYEPGQIQREIVSARPGSPRFYYGDIDDIEERFDLSTMVHVLEHIEIPVEFLKKAAMLLRPGGALAAQVPDFTQNPFDLLIFDHSIHFDAWTLALAAERAGLEGEIRIGVMPKEISAALKPGCAGCIVANDARDVLFPKARDAVNWLARLRERALEASAAESFGIFGTAIASTWLSGEVTDRVKFYVDEDPGRIGRPCMGKPVLSPAEVPAGSVVILPLAPVVAGKALSRLAGLYPEVAWLADIPA